MDLRDTLQWQAAVVTEEEIMDRIQSRGLGDKALIKGSYVIQKHAPETIRTIPRLEMVFFEVEPEEIKGAILEMRDGSPVGITEIIEGRKSEFPESARHSFVVKSKVNNINSAVYFEIVCFKSRDSFAASAYCCAESSNKEDTPVLSGEEKVIPVPMTCPEGVFIDRLTEATGSGGFLDSMESYFDLYCLVSGVCLDGRRLGDLMKRFFSPDGLKEFAGFKDNKGLNSRWRAFAREKRVPVKDFPDLLDLVMQVLSPVAEAIADDREFFGTWMPELCRYID